MHDTAEKCVPRERESNMNASVIPSPIEEHLTWMYFANAENRTNEKEGDIENYSQFQIANEIVYLLKDKTTLS